MAPEFKALFLLQSVRRDRIHRSESTLQVARREPDFLAEGYEIELGGGVGFDGSVDAVKQVEQLNPGDKASGRDTGGGQCQRARPVPHLDRRAGLGEHPFQERRVVRSALE